MSTQGQRDQLQLGGVVNPNKTTGFNSVTSQRSSMGKIKQSNEVVLQGFRVEQVTTPPINQKLWQKNQKPKTQLIKVDQQGRTHEGILR